MGRSPSTTAEVRSDDTNAQATQLDTWEDEGGATRFVKENSVAATERHSGSTRVSVEHIRR